MRLLCFLGFILLTNCYHQVERNCKNFKIGDFYSETIINGELSKTRFKRENDLQIEVYNDHVDTFKLRWINDCEMIFKSINPKNMAEKKDIHLKILTTTDSSYTYEYSYVGGVKKQKGIAYKDEKNAF